MMPSPCSVDIAEWWTIQRMAASPGLMSVASQDAVNFSTAEKYASVEHLKDVEARLVVSIDRLSDRIDRLINRIDRRADTGKQ